jgi:spermidine/putrescine transport system permease protein
MQYNLQREYSYIKYLLPFLFYYIIFFYIPSLLVLFISFLKRNFIGGVEFKFTISNFTDYDYTSILSIFLKSTILNIPIILLLTILGFIFAFLIKSISNYKMQSLIIVLLAGLLASEGLVKVFSYNTFYSKIFGSWVDGSYIFQSFLCLLPIAILLIYFALNSISPFIYMAAFDLGSNNIKLATKIILPLIKKNIFSVLLISYTLISFNFLYPQMFLNGKTFLFGNYIKFLFMDIGDWPNSVITSILLLLGMIGIIFLLRYLLYYVIEKIS